VVRMSGQTKILWIVGIVAAAISLLLVAPDPVPWHAARASGVVTYLLLWLSMVAGLSSSSRIGRMLIPAGEVFDVHSFSAYLMTAALGIHVVSLIGDGWLSAPLSWILIPGASDYRTLPVAAGVVTAYLGLAITFSTYLRRIVGNRNWRRFHYLAFPMYALALAHAVYAGTDGASGWAQIMYFATSGALLFLVFLRILGGAVPERPLRTQ
jgi:predicted ferric reductase